MTKRENLLSLYRRKGYQNVPISFSLSPLLEEEFIKHTKSEVRYNEYYDFPCRHIGDVSLADESTDKFLKYFPEGLKAGATIDEWGIAQEPGSKYALHMTHMVHPMQNISTLSELKEYPFPDYENGDSSFQKAQVEAIHAKGLAAYGSMECTIWERSWYMRSMEELMMDMMEDDEKAHYILDEVTRRSIYRAKEFAKAGCDVLCLGDDIGMQHTIMMSEDLYCQWLKPRLKKLITEVKKINPQILVQYHSCGYVKPFIKHLIDAGVDILNPVQPECMDFKEIHDMYGDAISFNGTLGTQSTMPKGTPKDVKEIVFRNLKIAGEKGGLFLVPTHLLEPDVPWENVVAYMEACKEYGESKWI